MTSDLTPPRPVPQVSGTISRFGASGAVAAAVCAGFLWTAMEAPLPATWWVAAFLFLAIEQDVRSLRLPNWLTFAGLATALGLAFLERGLPGLGHAAAGAGAALAALFVPFALRWLGAGDVKAMMALGAFWGPEYVFPALFWMIIAGGVLAIALVVLRGEGLDLCVRWWRSLWITLSTRRVTYFGPAEGTAASGGLPFAVAIGIGATAYQVWGFPWT